MSDKMGTIGRWVVAVYVGALILGPAGWPLWYLQLGQAMWSVYLASIFASGVAAGYIAGPIRGKWAALLAFLWAESLFPVVIAALFPVAVALAAGSLGGWVAAPRETLRAAAPKGWRIAGAVCVFIFIYSLTAGRLTALHVLEMHRRAHHPYAEKAKLSVYPAGTYICVRDAPPRIGGRLRGRDISYYFDPTGLIEVGEMTVYY